MIPRMIPAKKISPAYVEQFTNMVASQQHDQLRRMTPYVLDRFFQLLDADVPQNLRRMVLEEVERRS